jgi:hypothetical protein
MKKQYISPATEIVRIDNLRMMAGSEKLKTSSENWGVTDNTSDIGDITGGDGTNTSGWGYNSNTDDDGILH